LADGRGPTSTRLLALRGIMMVLVQATMLRRLIARLTVAFQGKSEPRRSARSPRGREAGFTLVEMLVVIAIIGLVMGLVGPRVLGYLSESKVKTAHIQIKDFPSALDLFHLDNGRYPTANEGLPALMQKPEGATTWNGPYLSGDSVPKDPWGRPYVYTFPG